MSAIDEVKLDYYSKVDYYRKLAFKAFKAKDVYVCLQNLEMIVTMGLYAYDLELLRQIYHMQAQICTFFEISSQALIYFKKMRDVASDEGNKMEKIGAYENMGKCYSNMKQHDNAIKCHKK